MLRHIPAVLSPDLVKALMEMGEGDEIVLGEAGLPAHSVHPQVLRADGVEIADLLAGVLALIVAHRVRAAEEPRPRGASGHSADPPVPVPCRPL